MKRRTLTKIFVLSFYLFYSLFPLLYCLETIRPDDQPGRPDFFLASRSSDGRGPSTIESDRADEDGPATPHVLLRKKRAISTSFKKIIDLSFVPVAKVSTAPFQTLRPALTVPGRSLRCPNGFQFYHSGTSPPSV